MRTTELRCAVCECYHHWQVCTCGGYYPVLERNFFLWIIPRWQCSELPAVWVLRCWLCRLSCHTTFIKCGLGAITWKSVRQDTIGRSTAESECIAAGEVAKENQYVLQLAGDFCLIPGCVPVGCDNRAAFSLISDPIFAVRSKRMDVVYHHIRERATFFVNKWVSETLRWLTTVRRDVSLWVVLLFKTITTSHKGRWRAQVVLPSRALGLYSDFAT
jgi:hypothetical protein